jgi:hypothetical protein
MASFVIPALIVAAILMMVLWRFGPRQPAWMPADAQLQLHREARRPPRIPFATSVTITSHGGAETIAAESQDIAIGGMMVKPAVPLSVGQPIQISFDLPGVAPIRIPGVVCRSVGTNCFGIRFDVMDNQRAVIGEWVEQHRKPA